ncbi:MAG: hypothetical protein JNL06_06550 [Alphaproteobacteria bacterium]|nr:hypothetical protein [Alphaproteobacteria bacterium]
MADLIETTRWRADRNASEREAPPVDPVAAREAAAAKLEQRAALAVDRQNAMVEYEANRRALQANTERLRALRLERDEAAVLAKAAPKKAKAKRVAKIPAPLA